MAKVLMILLVLIFTVFGFGYEGEEKLVLPVEGVSQLDIDCGAGYLKVHGEEGLDRIEVMATVVFRGDREQEWVKDRIELSLEKHGSRAYLKSKIKTKGLLGIFKSNNARIDLDVRMPRKLSLDVDDGSGMIVMTSIEGDIKLNDGSGSLEIKDVGGNIKLDDGSGSIEIVDVKKNVRIVDGSGEMVVKSIGGDLKIDDGSGSLVVAHVEGDVIVDDGSGSCHISHIKGMVTADDGSGSLTIEHVDKDVIIVNAGSGSLTTKHIKGRIKK